MEHLQAFHVAAGCSHFVRAWACELCAMSRNSFIVLVCDHGSFARTHVIFLQYQKAFEDCKDARPLCA